MAGGALTDVKVGFLLSGWGVRGGRWGGEGELLVFDPLDLEAPHIGQYWWVSADEWAVLHGKFGGGPAIKVTPSLAALDKCASVLVNKLPKAGGFAFRGRLDGACEPAVHPECLARRLAADRQAALHYENGTIFVSKLGPGGAAALNSGATENGHRRLRGRQIPLTVSSTMTVKVCCPPRPRAPPARRTRPAPPTPAARDGARRRLAPRNGAQRLVTARNGRR